MADPQKVYIVGISDDGIAALTSQACEIIEQAELLIGSEQALVLVDQQDCPAEQFLIGTNLSEVVDQISSASDKRVVVLAIGDPLFYGVARYLCDRLGKDRFEVLPHVSTMQLAFARVKESWEDAYLSNLGTLPIERVIENIRIADTVGLFTSELHTPSKIAKALIERGIRYFSAYICENLGSRNEVVTHCELDDIADQEFSDLNVMILVRKPDVPDLASSNTDQRLFGHSDDAFLQSRPKYGLVTPSEIRAMALAQMAITPQSIIWDIGAGSGSVAIEAARLASAGTVYAIEMDPDDHRLIDSNAERFNVKNIQAILGSAPQAWADLPDPDTVFVGGSGRSVCDIVQQAYTRVRPGGHVVASVGSIDNIGAIHSALNSQSCNVNVWMVNIARGTYQLERVRFDALNPCFLVAAQKPVADANA